MKSQIIGLHCGLPSGGIQRLLLHLSKENASFWVISCDTIRRPDQWLPDHAQGFRVATDQLLELSKLTIWELVLQLYPKGATPAQIETYEDFENSDCLCCLIYYDCGWLDLYVKDPTLLHSIQELLADLPAEDTQMLTAANDGRIALHL